MLIEGFRKYKIYENNLDSQFWDIYVESSKIIPGNKTKFEGMEILGDGTILFETGDPLGTNGKVPGKRDYIKKYKVYLSMEERDKILELINVDINFK